MLTEDAQLALVCAVVREKLQHEREQLGVFVRPRLDSSPQELLKLLHIAMVEDGIHDE